MSSINRAQASSVGHHSRYPCANHGRHWQKKHRYQQISTYPLPSRQVKRRVPDRGGIANLMSVMLVVANKQLSMKYRRQLGENTTGLVLSLRNNFMQERT